MKKGTKACGWGAATLAIPIEADPAPALPATSLLDRFAEELADRDDIAAASAAIRVPEGIGQGLFHRLCRLLGPQAA